MPEENQSAAEQLQLQAQRFDMLRLSRAGACQFESFAFADEEMEEKIEGLFDSKDSEIANLSWME